MGNQCREAFGLDDHVNQKQSKLEFEDPIYHHIAKSTILSHVQQFPTQSVPPMIVDKLGEFNFKSSLQKKNSIWKFEDDKNDQYAGYLIAAQPYQTYSQRASQNQLPKDGQQVQIFLFKKEKNVVFRSSRQEVDQQANGQRKSQQFCLVLDRVYKGELNKRMAVDDAIFLFGNGEVYKGSSKNFQLDGGKGLLQNKNGTHSYQGQWKKGMPQGNGKEISKEEYQYDGQIQKGVWEGRGKLKLFRQGQCDLQYQGEFTDGVLQGQGYIRENNNLIYKGQFKDGKEHGQGQWHGDEGQVYIGQFADGQKQGKGEYRYSDNLVYEGMFQNDLPHGEGKLLKDGQTIEGIWEKGVNIMVFQ